MTNQKYFSEEVMGFLANVKIGTKMLGEVSIGYNRRRLLQTCKPNGMLRW